MEVHPLEKDLSPQISRRNRHLVHISMAITLILLIIIILIEGIRSIAIGAYDVTEGLEVLYQLENADISTIEARIVHLESQERADGNLSMKEFFTGIVVMGDSIADGLLAYDVLNPSSVLATMEAQVSHGLYEEIERLGELNPRIVFLSYGLNDVLAEQVTVEEFIEYYAALLDNIQNDLPDTILVVNAIFPLRDDALKTGVIEEFNEALRELSYRRRILFVNSGHLARTDLYEVDGIHFVPAFYESWADNMRRAVEL